MNSLKKQWVLFLILIVSFNCLRAQTDAAAVIKSEIKKWTD